MKRLTTHGCALATCLAAAACGGDDDPSQGASPGDGTILKLAK